MKPCDTEIYVSDLFHFTVWSQDAFFFPTNESGLSFFVAEKDTVVYKYIFVIHSSIYRPIGHLHYSVTMSCAIINVSVMYHCNEVFSSFERLPRWGIAGSNGTSSFNFLVSSFLGLHFFKKSPYQFP